MSRLRALALATLALFLPLAVACDWDSLTAEQQASIIASLNSVPKTCHEAVDKHWPASSRSWAHSIVQRESGGQATAQNRSSSAAGCFQLLSMHAWRFDAVGCSWAARYNADCNVRAALHLYNAAGTSPWKL